MFKPLPAAPPVGAKDDEIDFPRIRMQHDDTIRVAVLLDEPNGDALALRTLSQAGQKLETFALVR